MPKQTVPSRELQRPCLCLEHWAIVGPESAREKPLQRRGAIFRVAEVHERTDLLQNAENFSEKCQVCSSTRHLVLVTANLVDDSLAAVFNQKLHQVQ